MTVTAAPTKTINEAAFLLDRCHKGGDYAYFWTIDKNGKKQAHAYAIGKVRKLPAVDGDIYISVHPLKRAVSEHERGRIPDVQAINCFFAEFDGKDEVLESEYFHYLPDNFATLTKKNDISRAIKDAQEIVFYANPTPYLDRAKKRITAAPVAPSIVVFSGGGFHCYWFLAETVLIDDNNRESIKEMQRNWVRVVGADKAAADLIRVLRVPGTVNCKSGLQRPTVKIVAKSTTANLTLAEFANIIALHPPSEQQASVDTGTNRNDCNDDVIETFNQTYSVADILLRNGYTKGSTSADGTRFSRPGRDNSQTSIVIFPNGRSYHHSGNDVLHTDGHTRDAFDAYTNLEHDGDTKAAYQAAKRQQGKWTELQSDSSGAIEMANEATRKEVEPVTSASIAASDTEKPSFSAGERVLWRNQDHDVVVTIREYAGIGNDSRHYFYTTEGAGAIPADELIPMDEPHPLNTSCEHSLNLGWIDTCTELMTRITGSPREFNQLCALVTVASVLERRARLRMAFADIYPNIFGAIVAPSSVYHKSSAISKVRTLLTRAMLDGLLLSELQTSEGLLGQMQTQSAGVILRDEIGTLFGSHNTKYLANLKPDLTALYDCNPYSRTLSKEKIKVEKPYLNILGATTPAAFYESVTMRDWQDGFMARWLFVTPETEPNFDAMTGLSTAQIDTQIGELAVDLMNINRQHDTDFQLHGDAFSMWDKWQRNAAKDAYHYGDDVSAAIVTRYAAYALKFSIILSAVNGSWGVISPETMQTSIQLSDNYKSYVHKLLSEKQNYGISGAKLQKVFSVIKTRNLKGDKVTRKVIQQYANIVKAQLDPCIEKLLEIGAIGEDSKHFFCTTQELPVKVWK